MLLVDSWRLFGPNLQTRGPAALAEVSFEEGEDVVRAVSAWRVELLRMGTAVGLETPDAAARVYRGGAVLTFSATIDRLLPATDVNEWAVTSAASVLRGEGPSSLEPQRTEIAAALVARASPGLLALEAESAARHVPFLWDDESITLGAGKRSRTWAMAALPAVEAVQWAELGPIPLALVTGTNGKTTSVRLLARILELAGRTVGMTTTDGVSLAGRMVESGDYTGPAGALLALRAPDVDAAVLETARGGILRRGLVVRAADVALLTNVSDDHLGHYGIDDLEALARVKAVVGSVVPRDGRVVVNADDPFLMAECGSFRAPLVLFSLDPDSPIVAAHRAKGGEAWMVKEGSIVRATGDEEHRLLETKAIPIGRNGTASYNLANALGAAASARALGVTDADIAHGLSTFTSSPDDNPGRGNLLVSRGVAVLIDFAHNPAAIRSVLSSVVPLEDSNGRLHVVAGYAGDRSDASIRDAARVIADSAPASVVLRDLRGYLRGRAPGEIPARLGSELEAAGVSRESIEVAPSEAEALRRALSHARPGDLVVVLAHLESDEVRAALAERG
jgi:cyanophycin synthetase